jgi:hypothetical protein
MSPLTREQLIAEEVAWNLNIAKVYEIHTNSDIIYLRKQLIYVMILRVLFNDTLSC